MSTKRVRWFLDLGYPRWPYSKGHDEWCNDVRTFAIPFLGGVHVYSHQRRGEDGLWYTSGGTGKDLVWVTTSRGERYLSAAILVSPDEFDAVLGEAEHPKLWTDAEVFARGDLFEMWLDDDERRLTREEAVAVATAH